MQKGLKRDQEREVRAEQKFVNMRRKYVLFIWFHKPHETGERREEEAGGGGQAAELRVSERGLCWGERDMKGKYFLKMQFFSTFTCQFLPNNRSLMKDDRMESNKKKNVVDVAELEEDFM